MSSLGQPGRRGQLAWSIFLTALVLLAIVISIIPLVALVRGFAQVVTESRALSGADAVAYGFAFTGLFLGAVFFTYAIKYYLGTAIVLLTSLLTGGRNGNGNPTGAFFHRLFHPVDPQPGSFDASRVPTIDYPD